MKFKLSAGEWVYCIRDSLTKKPLTGILGQYWLKANETELELDIPAFVSNHANAVIWVRRIR